MIDRSKIDDVLEGGRQLLFDLSELFKTGGLHRLSEMKAALATNDYKTLFRLAHTFKSNGANLGAEQVVVDCKMIEHLSEMADPNRATEIRHHISDLTEHFQEALTELEEICAQEATKQW